MLKRMTAWVHKHKGSTIIMAVAWMFITLYLGGLITQVTSLNDVIFSEEKVPFIVDPIGVIKLNFTEGHRGIILMMVLYAIALYYIIKFYRQNHIQETESDDRGFETEKSGVYGTSYLMKKDEVRKYAEVEPLKRTKGIIIGKYINENGGDDEVVSVPPDGKRYKYDSITHLPVIKIARDGTKVRVRESLALRGNRHIMVIGPSGCGKSFCYSRPAIFQSIKQGSSIIITDPKGELFSDTSEYAKQHGYTVRILNLAHPEVSDSWDALGDINEMQLGIDTQNFCNIIIENTTNPNNKGDEVFTNGEKNLLTALVLYVKKSPRYEGRKDLGSVYKLVCKSVDELASQLNQEIDETNPAYFSWNTFLSGSPNFKGNVIQGLSTRLQVMQDETIRKILGTKDFDLTLPGQQKCAYYVIMSDMNSTFKFISSLFFTCLFNKLVDFSRAQPGQKLPVPVNVIMDEFVAIGKLPDFDKKLATVRSAGINISMIFQTLAQLQNMYPDGLWETLIANCSTMLLLQCNDITTAKYMSDRGGQTTISVKNKRIDTPMLGVKNIERVQESLGVGQRNVMELAEVITMHPDKSLVCIANANLFLVNKFPYTDMIDPSTLTVVNMMQHKPAWKKQAEKQRTDSVDICESETKRKIPGEYESKYESQVNEEEDIDDGINNAADPLEVKNEQPLPQQPREESQDDDVVDSDEITKAETPNSVNKSAEKNQIKSPQKRFSSNTVNQQSSKAIKEF